MNQLPKSVPSRVLNLIESKFMDVNFNINLFLHFLILYTFLTIFFITFISKVSANAFNGEVTNIINHELGPKIKKLKEDSYFSTIIENLPMNKIKNLFSKPDEAVINYNSGIFNACMISVFLLWISFIVIVLILKFGCQSKLDIGEIIFENIIIFSAIGFAEYYFFTKVALKFVPVQPSFIYKQFFESIKSEL